MQQFGIDTVLFRVALVLPVVLALLIFSCGLNELQELEREIGHPTQRWLCAA